MRKLNVSVDMFGNTKGKEKQKKKRKKEKRNRKCYYEVFKSKLASKHMPCLLAYFFHYSFFLSFFCFLCFAARIYSLKSYFSLLFSLFCSKDLFFCFPCFAARIYSLKSYFFLLFSLFCSKDLFFEILYIVDDI